MQIRFITLCLQFSESPDMPRPFHPELQVVIHHRQIDPLSLPPTLAMLQQLEVVEHTSRKLPVALGTLPNLKHLTLWWLEDNMDDTVRKNRSLCPAIAMPGGCWGDNQCLFHGSL